MPLAAVYLVETVPSGKSEGGPILNEVGGSTIMFGNMNRASIRTQAPAVTERTAHARANGLIKASRRNARLVGFAVTFGAGRVGSFKVGFAGASATAASGFLPAFIWASISPTGGMSPADTAVVAFFAAGLASAGAVPAPCPESLP